MTGGATAASRPNMKFTITPLVSSTLSGTVTNAASGLPVFSALVRVGDSMTYTLLDGSYSLTCTGGDVIVEASKLGFDNNDVPFTLAPGTNTLNVALSENTAAPSSVLAALNTGATAVNVTWGKPMSGYMITYDDGEYENLVSWATEGNINAVKFVPLAQYPVTITGGWVNIGNGTYPSGNVLTAFEMAVYDDDGALGYPNTELGRIEVVPGNFGWIHYEFPAGITITSGNFYIGMIQGGNYPNCAPIAVDETNPSMVSYSKYESAAGPWVPAGYNDFMIRAEVFGSGGPLDLSTNAAAPVMIEKVRQHRASLSLHQPRIAGGAQGDPLYMPMAGDNTDATDALLSYQVWRLQQGQEGNEALWISLGTPTATSIVDNGWAALANGAYRWAVKAKYTGNRWSEPTFSNVLGKGWESNVTFNITLTSATGIPNGVSITMVNTLLSDTVYSGLTPATGTVNFPKVWKGNYDLTIMKFGYTTITENIDITNNTHVFNYLLQEVQWAPYNLYVDDRTLVAVWNAPNPMMALFEEHFTTGSYTTNGWTVSGTNWGISTSIGAPAPSALFNWSPQVTNYSQTITTPDIVGVGSPGLLLKYDIYLDNYGTTNENQMAAEIWDGANWNRLKNYTNLNGSFGWTPESINIAAYTWETFKIRFQAYGVDSYDINNWNIDNIVVACTLGDKSLLGYDVYLDDIQIAYTVDTTYLLPASVITYGHQYTCSVDAVYESGTSDRDYYTFTAHFLPPPVDLTGLAIQDAAYLEWLAPVVPGKKLAANAAGNLPVLISQPSFEQSTEGSAYIGDVNLTYIPGPTDAELFNNGPFVNSPGTGAGGADESILQGGLGMTTYGSGCQQTAGNSIADDVVVPSAWTVDELDVFTYQTGSTTTSTITGAMVRVWNGDPTAGGTVIWGDLTTNIMTATSWTNAYRNDDGPGGSTNRPIMKVTCNIGGLSLAPGTYWFEWTLTGSGSSGPWAPAITINGQTTTGNALQNQSGTWVALTDVGPQGMPFVLRGSGGGAAADCLGYNVYRDGTLVAYVEAPTTEYYDLYLNPGQYCYTVTAVYDLEPYGFPVGTTDESLEEGPACV
ncbi:MAG: hypothetical protein CVU06_08715, partial [Bacteroidetes bacterium HGW-Bacteroidetes-22]